MTERIINIAFEIIPRDVWDYLWEAAMETFVQYLKNMLPNDLWEEIIARYEEEDDSIEDLNKYFKFIDKKYNKYRLKSREYEHTHNHAREKVLRYIKKLHEERVL